MNSPNRNLAIVKAVRGQKRSPSQVAKQFGISRQRVYQILHAFDAGGTDAIAPKSRAPRTHPQAVPDTVCKDIITIRKQLTRHGLDAGPETIAYHLQQDGKRVLSTSTIRRILRKEGLITPA
ncbi:helix-turn-helix domain-containing protein, partial [Corynebacterium accolens]